MSGITILFDGRDVSVEVVVGAGGLLFTATLVSG
jgi:hypothetical protein